VNNRTAAIRAQFRCWPANAAPALRFVAPRRGFPNHDGNLATAAMPDKPIPPTTDQPDGTALAAGGASIDKHALLGGCVRLPLDIDIARLQDEVTRLPPELWGTRGGRVGVHQPTEGIFLRGHAPIEGPKPIEDRQPLQHLPYVRELLQSIPASPMRCLLAKLLPGGIIRLHVDKGAYFEQTLRIHVPVVSDPSIAMVSDGRVYTMRPGEAWALNNSTYHGVLSAWTQPRVHLICDFLPSDALCALVGQGERELGRRDEAILRAVTSGAEP
jgi:hypothetical protein